MMVTPRQVRDADIARRVRSALHERLGYVADGLELDVHDVIVALAGDVESGNQKTVAEKTIGELAGVGAVDNRVRIVPPSKLAMRTLRF
jgi:osmotically-inducible protein OsmY